VMVLSEDHRREVIATLACCAVLAAVGYIRQRRFLAKQPTQRML
jgi:GABA permease